ncbi:hypothetical protein Pme01_21930 [Planosporangium mesophilum]|uniref:Uncharacterized protein n=1 Tax=Planosporangium mesophilum TaxID=689768 RepID=A0A8J3X0E7_9ACTN|nr:hypothetical protein Pme01_21930 [Planosporangium mesophilum]
MYLRQDHLGDPLDEWLLTALAPHNLEATITAMEAAQPIPAEPIPDATGQILAECDRKIANYRALLDSGTDPALVAGWIAEVTAVRTAAENQRPRRPDRVRLTKEQIHGLIGAVGDLRTALRRADAAAAKAELYQRLRIRLTYDPGRQIVRAESELSPDDVGNGSVSEGGLEHLYVAHLHQRGVHAEEVSRGLHSGQAGSCADVPSRTTRRQTFLDPNPAGLRGQLRPRPAHVVAHRRVRQPGHDDASFVPNEPWECHSKGLLPKALAYPVGWDVLNCQRKPALAGARVTSLFLGRPDRHSADTARTRSGTADAWRRCSGPPSKPNIGCVRAVS